MEETARNLRFRQGDILNLDAVSICKLGSEESSEHQYPVVISHDCDLAASMSKEPKVEVIIGKRVPKLGRDSFAKTARRLQIEYQSPDGPIFLELEATRKVFVSKETLFNCTKSSDITLNRQGLVILQNWLAARYRRTAFPEAFEKCLRSPKKSSKINFLNRLESILEKGGDSIRGLLFDLSDGVDVERVTTNDKYKLGVLVLFNSVINRHNANEVANIAAHELEQLFYEEFKTKDGQWQCIELMYCESISDESITLAELERFLEWRLEHLSLKDYLPQSSISRGS